MKLDTIEQKISFSLKDNVVTAREASEIRDDMLELSAYDKISLADKVNIKELTPDARTIIDDLYASRDNLFAFSQQQRALIKSVAFQRVLPNFASLPVYQQQEILKAYEPFLQKFPNFFEKLAALPNDNYGKGFQFFFADSSSSELGKIIREGMAGIVNPGANVIKNTVLNGLLSPFAGVKGLDVGAMFSDTGNTTALLTHEMTHVVHLNFLNDDQRDKIGNLFDHARRTNSFITEYAKTNPYEYFADSVKYYFSPAKELLQVRDPEMFSFIKEVFESKPQYGADGNLFNDPENISLTYSRTAGQDLAGVTVGRESSVVTIEHFNGSTVSELALLGNSSSLAAKGSFGLKAAWKPWNAPVSTYGTFGATANGGVAGGKLSAGIGAFAGAGIDIYHFNAEFRENFVTNGSGPEVRVGYKLEF
jgi:hypothetical protein